jgi:hypothetical protein
MVGIVRSLPALTVLQELYYLNAPKIFMWSSVLTNTYNGMRVQNLEYRTLTSVLIDKDPSHKISLEVGGGGSDHTPKHETENTPGNGEGTVDETTRSTPGESE